MRCCLSLYLKLSSHICPNGSQFYANSYICVLYNRNKKPPCCLIKLFWTKVITVFKMRPFWKSQVRDKYRNTWRLSTLVHPDFCIALAKHSLFGNWLNGFTRSIITSMACRQPLWLIVPSWNCNLIFSNFTKAFATWQGIGDTTSLSGQYCSIVLVMYPAWMM